MKREAGGEKREKTKNHWHPPVQIILSPPPPLLLPSQDHITLADYEIHDGMGLELYYN